MSSPRRLLKAHRSSSSSMSSSGSSSDLEDGGEADRHMSPLTHQSPIRQLQSPVRQSPERQARHASSEPFSPSALSISSVRSRPRTGGGGGGAPPSILSPVAPPRPLPIELEADEYTVAAAESTFMSPVERQSESLFIRTKVEELEDAFSLLQTCATSASVKQEAATAHSSAYQSDQNAVLEAYWREEISALTSKHELQLAARDHTDKARKEAEKILLVDKYTKKLEKFKSSVQAAEKAYRDKHIQILGALDESRREILSMKKSFALREDELRQELAFKDKQLAKQEALAAGASKQRSEKIKWRSVAVEVASNIVELSCDATFVETPEAAVRRNYAHSQQEHEEEDRAIVSKSFLYDLVVNSKVLS
jgi:hypothetical protein